MSESTLSLKYEDIQAAIGRYLSLDPEPSNWTEADTDRVDACIQDGYRKFLYPPPTRVDLSRQQNPKGHSWSFLRPVRTLYVWPSVAVDEDVTVTGVKDNGTSTVTCTGGTPFYPSMIGKSIVITDIGTFTITAYTSSTVVVVSGDATCAGKTFSIASNGNYPIPDDVIGVAGGFTYSDTYEGYKTIKVIGEATLRAERQRDQGSSFPSFAAIRPIEFVEATGQRYEVMFFRYPDAAYPLEYRADVLPNKLATGKYPLGGMQHNELLKYACLSIAERDIRRDRDGVYEDEFIKTLEASVRLDREHGQATFHGLNTDPSRGEGWDRHRVRTFTAYPGAGE